MCAPVSQTRPDSSEGELADDSNMPSRKHHQSKSPQGEAGSYHLQLHPSLGRCGVSLEGCCIYKFHKLSVLWLLLFIGTF